MNRLTRLILSLAMTAWCVAISARAAQTNTPPFKWESEIAAFEKQDRTNPPPQGAILFLGSSSIRFWKGLPQAFPDKKVINRGFGGSHIKDSTAVIDRIVVPYHPRQIVFYAGDNDLAAGESPDGVIADFKEFTQKVHEQLPATVIDYISIKPCTARWKYKTEVQAVNAGIKGMTDPKVGFIDIYPKMLDAEGNPRPDLLQKDGLHPNAKCYELWAEIIRPYLN